MKKGFNEVLSAIKGISGGKKEDFSETKKEEAPVIQKNEKVSMNQDVQDKPKTPQTNYMEEYRNSLRDNSPLKGFVGIKDKKFKANNIGSYV
jgi:hypothetical protein